MNEQNRKQVILAAILGIALLGVLVYQFVLREAPPLPSDALGNDQSTQTTGSPVTGAPATVAAPALASAPGGAAPPAGVRAPAPYPPSANKPLELEDIQAMIASVEVKPIDYPQVRIARNPMTPLVGSMRQQGSEGASDAPAEVMTQVKIDTTASKQVSGIIWDPQYPVAIVDDMVVHVGYVFPNGAQVQEIEPTRVLFKVGNTIIPVEMKEY